jgi:hypothetical protein
VDTITNLKSKVNSKFHPDSLLKVRCTGIKATMMFELEF